MRWVWAKIMGLAGAAIAAVCAVTGAQGPAFVQAYLQRLGGHIDEARRTLSGFAEGANGQVVNDEAMRQLLVTQFSNRVAELSQARAEIMEAHPLLRPVVMALQGDADILAATAREYTPAMPLDTASLIYAAAGLAIGWGVWELIQSPFRARARRRRQARLMAGRT